MYKGSEVSRSEIKWLIMAKRFVCWGKFREGSDGNRGSRGR